MMRSAASGRAVSNMSDTTRPHAARQLWTGPPATTPPREAVRGTWSGSLASTARTGKPRQQRQARRTTRGLNIREAPASPAGPVGVSRRLGPYDAEVLR